MRYLRALAWLWLAACSSPVRLTVEADDIPSQLEISSAVNTSEYDRVRIGEEEFLLPLARIMMGRLVIPRGFPMNWKTDTTPEQAKP